MPKICGSERVEVQVGDEVRYVPANKVDYWRQVDSFVRDRQRREFEYRCSHLWRSSGVPTRHADAVDLRDTATGPWSDAYHRLASRLDSGFIVALLGRSGTGKTQLAACLIRTATDQGIAGRYIKASDLIDNLIESMQAGRHASGRDPWKRPGLLVIDEFHERSESEYANRSIKNIIDHRYDAGLSTLLIANQDKATFAQSAGSSIVSRIHETGEAIDCDWPSYRSVRHG